MQHQQLPNKLAQINDLSIENRDRRRLLIIGNLRVSQGLIYLFERAALGEVKTERHLVHFETTSALHQDGGLKSPPCRDLSPHIPERYPAGHVSGEFRVRAWWSRRVDLDCDLAVTCNQLVADVISHNHSTASPDRLAKQCPKYKSHAADLSS